MNKDVVSKIIEEALRGGARSPGLFDLPKVIGLKHQLQSCTSIDGVLAIIDAHRSLISKAFGLSEAAIEETMRKLKVLEK